MAHVDNERERDARGEARDRVEIENPLSARRPREDRRRRAADGARPREIHALASGKNMYLRVLSLMIYSRR